PYTLTIGGTATYHLVASDGGYAASNPDTAGLQVSRSDGQANSLPSDLFQPVAGGGTYSCTPTMLRLDTVNTIRIYSR
ncbi:MAG: hypothetical protein M3256_24605, partial [Actinomycetota bacterium]|nr:hypothetical protein [Actinomycetota bacterium]